MKDLIEDLNGRDVPEAEADAAAKTETILQARRFNPAVKPPTGSVLFTLNVNGKTIGVATTGNLVAVLAQVKAGKTAALGAMQACIMLPENSEADCFGFKSSNLKGLAVLSFDTEQSPADHWEQVQSILRRAGLLTDAPPPWFYSYSLAGLDLGQRLKCIEKGIELAKKECGGIHSVFIDGGADCVSNVNDPVESNAYIARLHGLAIEHVCVIVCALHFNPGDAAKARGHFGSELERKAETNLRLDKDEREITEIWSNKNRKAGIPKRKGPCFQWSDAAGMHVSVESKGSRVDKEKSETLAMLADDIFRKRPAMSYSDIVAYLTAKKGLKLAERTAARRISELSRLGLIEKSAVGLWTPSKKR